MIKGQKLKGTIVALVGDILPTRSLSDLPVSAAEVFKVISSADFSVGNFEMPLTDRGWPIEKLLNIRAHPDIASSVGELGVDLVTVANNHSVDFGWDGLSQTVDLLQNSGVAVIGAGLNVELARRPALHTVGGVTIGVIAFSCLLPTGMAASPDRPGISPIHIDTGYEVNANYQMEEPGDIAAVRVRTSARERDVVEAEFAIKELKKMCDKVVITIHWGFGSGEELAEYQEPLARRLLDAGGDVIHGHHPHAVHGIGFHRGKPILFSLGTLVGQQVFLDAPTNVKALWKAMSPDGYIASIRINSDERTSVEIIPTRLGEDRLPMLAQGQAFDSICERLKRLSRPLGANIEHHDAQLRASAL